MGHLLHPTPYDNKLRVSKSVLSTYQHPGDIIIFCILLPRVTVYDMCPNDKSCYIYLQSSTSTISLSSLSASLLCILSNSRASLSYAITLSEAQGATYFQQLHTHTQGHPALHQISDSVVDTQDRKDRCSVSLPFLPLVFHPPFLSFPSGGPCCK